MNENIEVMKDPSLLAVETSTEACSAALLIGGEIAERYEIAPRAHARLILGMVDELLAVAELKPQQLDAIAFGCGPGAFTGVRIAAGVVQGIAFGADLPVIPVSSLAALAQDAIDCTNQTRILAAIDARMGELYWGIYRRGDQGYAVAVGDEQVTDAARVVIPDSDMWFGAGSGWHAYGELLRGRLEQRLAGVAAETFPRARSVARLAVREWTAGNTVAADQALPVYLRNRVVQAP